MDNIIYALAVNAIPFLLAITMHEAAHGYAARALGDRTPQACGRLSLNPLNHFDWVGTALLPVLSVVVLSAANAATGFVLGWAKPTPINAGNFQNPRRDYAWVVLAGVFANVLMGIAWAVVYRFFDVSAVRAIAAAGMLWNVGLIVLHLIPIPPLAGGMALAAVLPADLANRYLSLARYGFFVLAALALTGVLGVFVKPAYVFGLRLLSTIAEA